MGVSSARRVIQGVAAGAILKFAAVGCAAVTTITPVITDPASGHSYQLLSNANWLDSEAAAETLGGHLAVIRNQEQQDFVFNIFGGYGGTQRILWIGLSDPSQDANGGTHAQNFVWVDGEPVTYTDWDPGEPNGTGTEIYAAMYYPNFRNPGSWNDWVSRTADPIGIKFYGVVEYAPEPTARLMAVLGLGAGMLTRRGRRATPVTG